MLCSICGQRIVLVPSAADRARMCGGKPGDYTKLFTQHATCTLEKRSSDVSDLLKRIQNANTR